MEDSGKNQNLLSHHYEKYVPILSMNVTDNSMDIPIPTWDDWRFIANVYDGKLFGKEYTIFPKIKDFDQVKWEDKIPTIIWRGSSTGRGTTEKDNITILATGPLTADQLSYKIQAFTGIDACHFFDAASPIIYGDTIDQEIVFKASRYDKGDPAYLNCPMDKNDYIHFRNELIEGEQANLKDFEKESANFFEACLPIEEIARRGVDTMRYGPLKSIGLWNPKWGDLFDRENRLKKRPHAVVQLRKEDLEGKLLNMVGFQTNLKWSEQKRIFRLIPGLEKAEFVRFGVMHRNTFLESPKLLLPTLQFMKRENLFAAGQITGTEGYAAAAAGGLLAGINASLLAKGKKPVSFPDESMIGSLMNFISNKNQILSNQKKNKFQPMPASFGLVPELTKRIKDKRLRYKAYQERSTEALNDFKNKLDSCFDKDHLLSKIY